MYRPGKTNDADSLSALNSVKIWTVGGVQFCQGCCRELGTCSSITVGE